MYKSVPGYEGLYEVSPCGCVRSCRSGKQRLWKPAKSGKMTYAAIYLYRNGKRKFFLIHRLVMEVFGPGESDLVVNHKDFNPLNNHIDNLEYLTRAENIQYSIKAGRYDECRKNRPCGIKYKPRTRPNKNKGVKRGPRKRENFTY